MQMTKAHLSIFGLSPVLPYNFILFFVGERLFKATNVKLVKGDCKDLDNSKLLPVNVSLPGWRAMDQWKVLKNYVLVHIWNLYELRLITYS